jgi:hypothetical protein
MNMVQIRRMARGLGIKAQRKNKTSLVREIQTAEGHFPCFRTAHGWCDQPDCLWRSDCLK